MAFWDNWSIQSPVKRKRTDPRIKTVSQWQRQPTISYSSQPAVNPINLPVTSGPNYNNTPAVPETQPVIYVQAPPPPEPVISIPAAQPTFATAGGSGPGGITTVNGKVQGYL